MSKILSWLPYLMAFVAGMVLGVIVTNNLVVSPARKINALHMEAWTYMSNLDPGTKVVDVFILPLKVGRVPAESLVLRLMDPSKKEDIYIAFSSEGKEALNLIASELVPRTEE